MSATHPPRVLQWAASWRFNLVTAALAFGVYFCMYAFRKPFAAAGYVGVGSFGLELKTIYILSQILGYAASKVLSVRIGSEASRGARLKLLLALVGSAELALLLFACVPLPFKPLALFLNGLPLGMVWGLVVRYLEGRRSSEFLLAGLCTSFIVASGAVKDVGKWALRDLHVSEFWMPAFVGLLFLGPFAALAWALDHTAEPSPEDQAARMLRREMHAADRLSFWKATWPGLVGLLLGILMLTAFRDYRDNYAAELIAELGYADRSVAFSRTELPIAIAVLVVMAALGIFQRPLPGLLAVFATMIAGFASIGLSTGLWQSGWLGAEAWMAWTGLGLYLAYVPFSSFLFDRLMAATRHAGTAVFAINLCDAVGYFGSVGLQLWKDFAASETTRLHFFVHASYGVALGGSLVLLWSALYFYRLAASGRSPAGDPLEEPHAPR